jgi:hypothetical protein
LNFSDFFGTGKIATPQNFSRVYCVEKILRKTSFFKENASINKVILLLFDYIMALHFIN